MHGVEIIDGKGQMFSGEGITPWHYLGTVVEGCLNAEEALKAAGLDWLVELQPIKFGPNNLPFPDRFATVRSTDQRPLGVVGPIYKPLQNADAFAFTNIITHTGSKQAVFSTAGSLFNGARIFLTLKIGDTFMVGDNDAHDLYLQITNSHDGTKAFEAAVTPIRAVCNNTVTLGSALARTKWSMTHKSDLSGKVQEAREALEMSFKYEDAFQKEVQALMDIDVTTDKFFQIVDNLVPASPRQHDNDVESVMEVWKNEPTVKMGGGEGNAWGAFNAWTYWTDNQKDYRTPESRFKNIIGTGTNQGFAEKSRPKLQKALLALS